MRTARRITEPAPNQHCEMCKLHGELAQDNLYLVDKAILCHIHLPFERMQWQFTAQEVVQQAEIALAQWDFTETEYEDANKAQNDLQDLIVDGELYLDENALTKVGYDRHSAILNWIEGYLETHQPEEEEPYYWHGDDGWEMYNEEINGSDESKAYAEEMEKFHKDNPTFWDEYDEEIHGK